MTYFTSRGLPGIERKGKVRGRQPGEQALPSFYWLLS